VRIEREVSELADLVERRMGAGAEPAAKEREPIESEAR
jgi:hypothetical protein